MPVFSKHNTNELALGSKQEKNGSNNVVEVPSPKCAKPAQQNTAKPEMEPKVQSDSSQAKTDSDDIFLTNIESGKFISDPPQFSTQVQTDPDSVFLTNLESRLFISPCSAQSEGKDESSSADALEARPG